MQRDRFKNLRSQGGFFLSIFMFMLTKKCIAVIKGEFSASLLQSSVGVQRIVDDP